jgi:hypothetical protein
VKIPDNYVTHIAMSPVHTILAQTSLDKTLKWVFLENFVGKFVHLENVIENYAYETYASGKLCIRKML